MKIRVVNLYPEDLEAELESQVEINEILEFGELNTIKLMEKMLLKSRKMNHRFGHQRMEAIGNEAVKYVPTDDVPTKGLAGPKHSRFSPMFGIQDVPLGKKVNTP
ncbi:hypothetical protein JTB14_034225 [Gonioctena quinquepunctata]|nr:hypothetical protein JTB14_034225 [Gonioctena quinquepunctata]